MITTHIARTVATSVASCALICATLAIVACGSHDASATTRKTSQSDPLAGLTVNAYTVRGEVVSLPDAVQDLQIRHEAIPEFQNPGGSMGMNTMTMPFWPPQGIAKDDPRIAARIEGFSLEGIAVDQKVEFAFDVLFDAEHKLVGYYATSIHPLPAETVLDFSPLK